MKPDPEQAKNSLIVCIVGLAAGFSYMFWIVYCFLTHKDKTMLERPDAVIIILLTVSLVNAVGVVYKVYKSGQS